MAGIWDADCRSCCGSGSGSAGALTAFGAFGDCACAPAVPLLAPSPLPAHRTAAPPPPYPVTAPSRVLQTHAVSPSSPPPCSPHSCSASSMLCVVRMMAREDLLARTTSHSARREAGSRPVEGSSWEERQGNGAGFREG